MHNYKEKYAYLQYEVRNKKKKKRFFDNLQNSVYEVFNLFAHPAQPYAEFYGSGTGPGYWRNYPAADT